MSVKTQDNYMVRCKADPTAPLRHFFLSTSIIYHKCSCGQPCSYAASNAHAYFKDHLDVFKLHLKPTGDARKNWDVYFDDIERIISEDPAKHQITWDTIR